MKSFFTTNGFSAFWFKVFILCGIVIVILTNTGLSQTWSEDWEGNWTTDWHVDAGTWEVGTPTSGPGSAYNGENCAATVLDGGYPSNANTRLIRHTSFVVPSAEQNPRLRFWHWYDLNNDPGRVQIKVGAGEWQTIFESYTNTGGAIWTYPSIDLTPYADSTVQICFYLVSDYYGGATGWYIDDVAVITGPIIYNNPETWEMGLGDWYAERGTWEVGTPTNGPGSAYNGENCAATVLGGGYPSNVNTRFISPSFVVPDVSKNPNLTFWHWYDLNNDPGTVQIKVGAGEWQTILGPYTNTSGGIWSPTFVDLTPYADSTVQICFSLVSDYYGGATGWYIDDINIAGLVTDINNNINLNPAKFSLAQNYPNPFNPTTKIKYAIPEMSSVTLKVYDVLGNEITTLVNEEKPAGSYEIEFSAKGGTTSGRDGYNLSSGIYFYKLQARNFVETKKMILMK